MLLGGGGRLSCAKGDICVDPFRYIGCSSEDVLEIQGLRVPEQGVVLVENLTPFHACVEQLGKDNPVLVSWLGGFPNRGVSRLIQVAASIGARIRVWCDIDLSGIRIARLVHKLSNGIAEPLLMEPGVVQMASKGCELSQTQLRNIERDLENHPNAILSETLRALLERGEWFEQETLLSKIPQIIGSNVLSGA